MLKSETVVGQPPVAGRGRGQIHLIVPREIQKLENMQILSSKGQVGFGAVGRGRGGEAGSVRGGRGG